MFAKIKKKDLFLLLSLIGVIVGFFILEKFFNQPSIESIELTAPHAPESNIGDNVEGDFFTSDNVRLHYWYYNRGTDLVTLFLHGGPGHDTIDFRALQAKAYADRFGSLLVFDQRGSGESERDISLTPTIIYSQFIDDINELRDYVIPSKEVVIFGRSFGGFLAAQYASSRPVGVKGYILVAPGVFDKEVYDQGSEILNAAQNAETDSTGQSSLAKATERERVDYRALFPEQAQEVPARDPLVTVDESNFVDVGGALTANEGWPNGHNFSLLFSLAEVPTIVVSGEYDKVVPPLAIKAMKLYLPKATFIELKGGWHYATYVQQDVFFSALEEFFKTI